MRVAALYDMHRNLPALRAVLAEVAREDVDVIVVGGDVAAGPLPSETLDELMALGERARFVRGNADREVVDAYDQGRREPEAASGPAARMDAFAASRISRGQRDFLAGFAAGVVLDVDGLGAALFCHGSPRSDTQIITPLTGAERLQDIIADVDQPTIVCGHTHRQFDRCLDRWRIINAGSVGVPYEGRAGAYWALLGPGAVLRRTAYDREAAMSELRAGGFPDLDDMLQDSQLTPGDADEISDAFERRALNQR
jgi:predicted phosphodiesterase